MKEKKRKRTSLFEKSKEGVFEGFENEIVDFTVKHSKIWKIYGQYAQK